MKFKLHLTRTRIVQAGFYFRRCLRSVFAHWLDDAEKFHFAENLTIKISNCLFFRKCLGSPSDGKATSIDLSLRSVSSPRKTTIKAAFFNWDNCDKRFLCFFLHCIVFPGWRWDLFCTRNDCAAQLQWWKPSQVSFRRKLSWICRYFGSGHQVNVCCWEIGLLSAAMALVVEPPAIGQVSLSEYWAKWGLSILAAYSIHDVTRDLISFSTGMWWRRVTL